MFRSEAAPCCSLCGEHRNLPYHAAAISVLLLQKLKHTESDKLQVQIQAYLDNVFDVGALLEDAETKNAALERVEELEENLSHVSVSASDWKNSLNGLISSLSLRINVQQIRMLMVNMPVPDAPTPSCCNFNADESGFKWPLTILVSVVPFLSTN